MKYMRLFDSHCHLDDPVYDEDRDEVIQRAKEAGVHACMVVGVNADTSAKAIELAGQYNHLVSSVGIHPNASKDYTYHDLEPLKKLAQQNSCVRAWGEIGLDFNRMGATVKEQENSFVDQMGTAIDLGLPLIFHERDSNGRFHEILKAHTPTNPRGVVHCFSGTKREMFNYLDLGYNIGVTGIVTILKRGAPLREIIVHAPEDRILIETDSPYLTPTPQRNKHRRNEPGFVKSVLLKLAEVRSQDPEVLSEVIFQTTQNFYGTDFD